MKKLIQIACLLVAATQAKAQNLMVVHQKLGGKIRIPMESVDSVRFLSQAVPQRMKIFLNDRSVYALKTANIDSITYSLPQVHLLPEVLTLSASALGSSRLIAQGSVENEGPTPVVRRGFCWSLQPMPSIINNHSELGAGTGSLYDTLGPLEAGRQYFVRAYASNAAGTAYGEEFSITTGNASAGSLPAVSGLQVQYNDGLFAYSGGNVTDAGSFPVTSRGVCWAIGTTPNINHSFSVNGEGTGSFSSTIHSLMPDAVYRVRAWACSDAGIQYGEVYQFTSDDFPEIKTLTAFSIGAENAMAGTEILDFGRHSKLIYGTCWSTQPNPDTSSSRSIDSTYGGNSWSRGPYNKPLRDLLPASTYYYRSYAQSPFGVVYGNERSFQTRPAEPTLTDIDGNVYKTVTIGSQVWMKENLRVTRFRNGDPIFGPVVNNSSWYFSDNTPVYCYFNNDSSYNVPMGKLYNSLVVSDPRKVCPTGWHVPSDEDWMALERTLGMDTNHLSDGNMRGANWNVAGKMMAVSDWWQPNFPNYNNTNESGFSAQPAGWRGFNGGFAAGSLGTYTGWWTSTQWTPSGNFLMRGMGNNSMSIDKLSWHRLGGLSVRCMKDSAQDPITTTMLLSGTSNAGSFEGDSLQALGWNTAQNNRNFWINGTLAGATHGSKTAFISHNGTGYNFQGTGQAPSANHMWRDFSAPAGETFIDVSFSLKGDPSGYQNGLRVYAAPIGTVPMAGVDTVPGATLVYTMYDYIWPTFAQRSFTFNTALIGTQNFRLIFTWLNGQYDLLSRPYALDQVQVISRAPAIFTSITRLKCEEAMLTGPVIADSTVSGVKLRLPYTGGNGNAYPAMSFASEGIGGLTASLPAGNFAFGDGVLEMDISGVPSTTSGINFSVSLGGKGCVVRDPFSIARPGCLKDAEGNLYKVVQVGSQYWMAENLRSEKFLNGDPIPFRGGGNCDTCFDYTNADSAFNSLYGKLYDLYTVRSNRGLCPAGWHVPSDQEWLTLELYLGVKEEFGSTQFENGRGGSKYAGSKLKSGSSLWDNPDWENYKNQSGFSALPAGLGGGWDQYQEGEIGNWWTSTKAPFNYPGNIFRSVGNNSTGIDRGFNSGSTENRFRSVRCIKDDTTRGGSCPANTLPVVSTKSPSVTTRGAIGGGTVLSNGGIPVSARGVCWSTSPGPTLASSKTVNRFGNGPYNSHITGLTPNTRYYVRAYATNSSGTSYGNQISFVTDSVTTPARVLDADGNSYPTVSIGSQLWMQTNLRTRKYQNGDTLRFANTRFFWSNPDSLGVYTFFQHQLNPVDTNFGGFYNWYAINNPRNLCPAGWHVPDEEDWEVLSSFLDSNAIAVNDPAVFKATHAAIYQGNGTPTGEFGGNWNYKYFAEKAKTGDQPLKSRIRLALDGDTKLLPGSSGFDTNGYAVRCVRD